MELWRWYNKYRSQPYPCIWRKGAYTVELTVKDSRGKESKEQTKVTVKQDRKQVDPEEEKVLPFNKLVKEI